MGNQIGTYHIACIAVYYGDGCTPVSLSWYQPILQVWAGGVTSQLILLQTANIIIIQSDDTSWVITNTISKDSNILAIDFDLSFIQWCSMVQLEYYQTFTALLFGGYRVRANFCGGGQDAKSIQSQKSKLNGFSFVRPFHRCRVRYLVFTGWLRMELYKQITINSLLHREARWIWAGIWKELTLLQIHVQPW